jgi:hypothetical protein
MQWTWCLPLGVDMSDLAVLVDRVVALGDIMMADQVDLVDLVSDLTVLVDLVLDPVLVLRIQTRPLRVSAAELRLHQGPAAFFPGFAVASSRKEWSSRTGT